MARRKRKNKPQKGNRGRQQGKANPKPNPPAAVIAPPAAIGTERIPDPASSNSRTQNQAERVNQETPDWFLKSQTWVGVCLVVFTLGQVVVGYWQWDATSDQYKAMTEQLDVMRLDQRPWLNVKSVTMESFEAGRFCRVNVTIDNTGRTQATITSSASMTWVVPDPEPFVERMKTQHRGVEQPTTSKLGIGPGGTTDVFVHSGEQPLTKKEFEMLQGGKLFMFVVGEVVYSDMSNTKHRTRWCFMYAADDKRFAPSPYGNDMD